MKSRSKSRQKSTKLINTSANSISMLDPKIIVVENNQTEDMVMLVIRDIFIEVWRRCPHCRELSWCEQLLSVGVYGSRKFEPMTESLGMGERW